jgi:AcrR family transcriptional regulator
VSTAPSRVAARLAGPRGHKFAARRQELAAQATGAVAQLGYARASMRELAQHCGASLGVLHYYFDDKNDLITCCVGLYKAQFIDRYATIVIDGQSGAALKRRISRALSTTLRESGVMHRLWYDLRTQGLFDDRFADHINAIDESLASLSWRAVTGYARLTHSAPTVTPEVVYATADGLFHKALRDFLGGDATAPQRLEFEIETALDDFVEEVQAETSAGA